MKTISAVLSRDYGEKETTGLFYIFEGIEVLFHCFMLELPRFVIPMKPNSPRTTCIPGGMTYKVKKIISPTKGLCFLYQDVPGRSAVEIHIGNFAAGKKVDTEGCQLPGSELIDINGDGNLDVVDSTATMKKLLEILPDEFEVHIL